MTDPTEQEIARLSEILRKDNAEKCECGHILGIGDIAWNNGETEAGTPYAFVEIECQGCGKDILCKSEWTEFEEWSEILDTIADAIDKRIEERKWRIKVELDKAVAFLRERDH